MATLNLNKKYLKNLREPTNDNPLRILTYKG